MRNETHPRLAEADLAYATPAQAALAQGERGNWMTLRAECAHFGVSPRGSSEQVAFRLVMQVPFAFLRAWRLFCNRASRAAASLTFLMFGALAPTSRVAIKKLSFAVN